MAAATPAAAGASSAVLGATSAPEGAGLCLLVRIFPDGPDLFEVPLPGPQGEFAVAFRHSVEKTWVVEHFVVRAGEPGFTLYRTEYRSLGAGLPTDGKIELQPEGPVLALELSRAIPRLVLRVSHIAGQSLVVGARSFDLSGAVPDGAALELIAADCRAEGAPPVEEGVPGGAGANGGNADGR